MPTCEICNNLQAEEEEDVAYDRDQSLKSVRASSEKGCVHCRLIWNVILHFDRTLAQNHIQEGSGIGSSVNIYHHETVGPSLSLAIDNLPSETYFPLLELYTTTGLSPYQSIGTASDVSTTLNLSLCLQLAQKWLRECMESHSDCELNGSGTLPTRVLDLGSPEYEGPVRLHISAPGEIAKYAALSYCWGSVGNLKTTTANISAWRTDVPWHLFSESFRDAILITKGLGIQFLWIDSLCIVQDDPNDWESESAKMGHIYENAFLTIATDAAKDPTCGILNPRSTSGETGSKTQPNRERTREIGRFPIVGEDGNSYIIQARERLDHFELVTTIPTWDVTYPLLSRAWTLQERLLSRRTLHFTAYELIWECKKHLLCECGSIRTDFAGDDWQGPKIAFEKALVQIQREIQSAQATSNDCQPTFPTVTTTWAKIISGYSARNLTNIADRLPAISGIAQKFTLQVCDSKRRTYLAGLWKEDLVWLLCWRVFGIGYEGRPDVYCGPTWSWVSVKSTVIWDTVVFEAASMARVLDSLITPSAGSVYGSVSSGYIVLQGPVQSATIEFDDVHPAVLGLRNDRNETIYFVPDQSLFTQGDQVNTSDLAKHTASASLQANASSLYPRKHVSCLWLLQNAEEDNVYGLVLASPLSQYVKRSISETEEQLSYPIFERVGLITAMSWQYQASDITASSWFFGSTDTVVAII